jgi:hypothetical protein
MNRKIIWEPLRDFSEISIKANNATKNIARFNKRAQQFSTLPQNINI